PRQMRTMLHQLIENALKFAHPDRAPKVRVHASFPRGRRRGTARMVELHIEDNGVGFDGKLSRSLLQPLRRWHAGPYAADGIGLAICRKIVALHGGRIIISSVPNAGTHVRVILPASAGSPHIP